uniref:F-box domain-containing protein n=3 Tax=Rhodosorus marinus TaxID=101924 RepID=A0A7S2ZMD2_9RHOD|mmetsp:Transcript_24068/g.94813  ORF Transcript_24068/g.94813 Transcript_24068/m.94813 type:complete len:346 (+) Transcript_24068:395-1432(+)
MLHGVAEGSTRKRSRVVMEGDDGLQDIQDDARSGNSDRPEEEMSVLAKPLWSPDSVPRMESELKGLIEYVRRKPQLSDANAAFMRDSLRTMLIKCTREAELAFETESSIVDSPSRSSSISGDDSKDENTAVEWYAVHDILEAVFRYLSAKDLSVARGVSKDWNKCGSKPSLWKQLCLRQPWRSLETDRALWSLIDPMLDVKDPDVWRKVYPTLARRKWWRCKLMKTNKFVCNLIVHQIDGESLGDNFPSTLTVERRFALMHLTLAMLPINSPLLYFEPETDGDKEGLEGFIQYLIRRDRAGLALEQHRRYIFIPPCDYSRDRRYEGKSLLGGVQLSSAHGFQNNI